MRTIFFRPRCPTSSTMWHTAKKYCRKETLWEEIIQESLVRLLACVPRLRSLPEEKLAGYILVTTRNTTYILAKKEAKEQERFISLNSVDLPDDVDAFRRVWLKLDARSQYLLEARYILNKPYDEIALELNIKPSSVRVAMTRTKEKAKRLILAEKASAQVKETV